MNPVNHQVRLAARPSGLPTRSDWELTTEPVPVPGPGEFVVAVSHDLTGAGGSQRPALGQQVAGTQCGSRTAVENDDVGMARHGHVQDLCLRTRNLAGLQAVSLFLHSHWLFTSGTRIMFAVRTAAQVASM